MVAAAIPSPRVEVLQEFQQVTPTVLEPTLVPCIVGPCYEIVELLDSSGAVNSEAQLTTPARIFGSAAGPDVAITSSARYVKMRINSGPSQTYALPLPTPLTSYSLALAMSYLEQNISGLRASTDSSGTYPVMWTSAEGDSASIELEAVSNDCYTELGLDDYVGLVYAGASSYKNLRISASFVSLPVVRGDIDQMDVDEDSIKVYLLQGGVPVELSRTEAVLGHKWRNSPTTLNSSDDPLTAGIIGTSLTGSVDTFPQTLYGHQLKAIDDGDADGTTPWFYARGTNAYYGYGTSDNNHIDFEAKGDQDPLDYGRYHGTAGNNLAIWYQASQGAADVLLSTAANRLNLHPVLQVTFTKDGGAGTPANGDIIRGETAVNPYAAMWTGVLYDIDDSAAPQYVAKVHTLTAIGAGAGYDPELFVSSVAAGDYDDIEDSATTWTANIDSVATITTASEIVAAIEADGDASDMFNVDAPIGTAVMSNPNPAQFGIVLGGAPTGIEDFKIGDVIEENAAQDWTAVVLTIDTSTDSLVVQQIDGSPVVPLAADVFRRKHHDSAQSTYTASTVASVVGTSIYGGRDPVDWSEDSENASVRAGLPGGRALVNHTAAYLKLSDITGGTLAVGNKIRTTRAATDEEADGVILQVGADYVMVAINTGVAATNPNSGKSGDRNFFAVGEALAEYSLLESATGVTATVAEFHTVATTDALCDVAINVGDSITIQIDASNEWTATVVNVTLLSGTVGGGDAKYRLILKDLVKATHTGTTYDHGLPIGSIVGNSGSVATHVAKTIPTAGAQLYLYLSGSSQIAVPLEGWEDHGTIATMLNTAVGEASDADYATVGADGHMALDNAQLNLTNPLCWRPDTGAGEGGVGGIENTIELGGDAVPYVFGGEFDLGDPADPDDYPATNVSWRFSLYKHFGNAFAVGAGDELYDGSTLLGTVVRYEDLNIGGEIFTNSKIVVDVDSEVAATEYDNWFVLAKSLTEETGPASYDVDRPYPELVVLTTLQEFLIRHDAARNYDGTPTVGAQFSAYMDWKGLRLDVTPSADNPTLYSIEDTTDLENRLGPTQPDNPLAWGIYMAILNAPDTIVTGIGVGEVTADQPGGTLQAHEAVATFLRGQRVYAIAPLTQDRTIHSMWQTHVDDMSEAENRGFRIALINEAQPTETVPDLVGSGTASTVTTNVIAFDPATINVASEMLSAGIDPNSTPAQFRDAGVYLDIASDAKKYLVSQVTGQQVTVVVAHAPGQNDDGYYAETNMPTLTVGGEAVSIYERGTALADDTALSTAINQLSGTYQDRRIRYVQPDGFGITYGGLEQEVDGVYACAAIAGQVAAIRPSSPLTGITVVGLTRVIGSSDKLNEDQMNSAAGGGVYWLVQEVDGGPVLCRQQLTTDVTSNETKEHSITAALDYGSYVLLDNLSPYVGRYNITDGFLDNLTFKTEGIIQFLLNNRIWAGAELNNIMVDADDPTTVFIDITVQPYYPCNKIRVTLVI